MATETRHICDGCDKSIIGDFPPMWKHVLVRIDNAVGLGDVSLQRHGYDLCDDCADRLLRLAAPDNWIRATAERP